MNLYICMMHDAPALWKEVTGHSFTGKPAGLMNIAERPFLPFNVLREHPADTKQVHTMDELFYDILNIMNSLRFYTFLMPFSVFIFEGFNFQGMEIYFSDHKPY